MSFIEQAIAANQKKSQNHDPALANKSAPILAIFVCMGARLNGHLDWLDIKPSDAGAIRNVVSAATVDVVRSLLFSIYGSVVRKVMIIGHTG